MEGVSHEAASLAGHLKLSNLCWIYDNNNVTIDGHATITFTDDTAGRFRDYGWRTLHVKDANDLGAITEALHTAASPYDGPTFIMLDTIIGYGAPHKQGTPKAHSDALGEEEVRGAKRCYGWPEDARFLVPQGVREHFASKFGSRGERLHSEWNERLAAYRKEYPDLARELDTLLAGRFPTGWDADLPEFPADAKGMATRASSGKVLGIIADRIAWFLGGAADLLASTKTKVPSSGWFEPGDYSERNIHFGVREHGMCAALNGMALCGLRTFGSSFLIFTDYARPALRLSALMELPTLWIFTHDSVYLGEDGPTHQPVEQLASFRGMPGLTVIRPADAGEVVETWRVAPTLKEPALIALTRQDVPTIDRSRYASAEGVRRGAYVLAGKEERNPEVLLLSSGSEVHLCLEAFERLKGEGISSRVISMPSWDLFEKQDETYRREVLPPEVTARVAIEAACPLGWDRYIGPTGIFLGMRSFGVSAPRKQVEQDFGFTPSHIVEAAKTLLGAGVALRRAGNE
jgi:transketolase